MHVPNLQHPVSAGSWLIQQPLLSASASHSQPLITTVVLYTHRGAVRRFCRYIPNPGVDFLQGSMPRVWPHQHNNENTGWKQTRCRAQSWGRLPLILSPLISGRGSDESPEGVKAARSGPTWCLDNHAAPPVQLDLDSRSRNVTLSLRWFVYWPFWLMTSFHYRVDLSPDLSPLHF